MQTCTVNVRFVLVFINILTLQTYMWPMRTLTSTSTARVIERFLATHFMSTFYSDLGREFMGKAGQMLRQRHISIRVASLTHPWHTSSAESVICRMRQTVARAQSNNPLLNFEQALQNFVESENAKIIPWSHPPIVRSSIITTAQTVKLIQRRQLYLKSLDPIVWQRTPKFSVGQSVRILNRRHAFDKISGKRFSTRVFHIAQILPANPMFTYKVSNSDTGTILPNMSFYENELQQLTDSQSSPAHDQ